MKKGMLGIILVLLSLLFIGCSANDSERENNNQAQTEQMNTEQNEEETPLEKGSDVVEDIDEDVPSEPSHEQESSDDNQPITPQYELTSIWSLKPIEEGVNEKVVLLTIDDAPDKHALDMAKTLNELNAPAIFFVNGHFLDTDEEKDVLKQIHEMGFSIGNHTFNHQDLSQVSKEKQKEEILTLNELIEEITGEKPKFFRAPHGINTDFVKELVEEQGMLLMNWSFGYDWNKEYMNEEAIADIMVNTELLGSGSNLLMHDREWTANALDDIVHGLRDNGYELLDPSLIITPSIN